MMQLSFITTLTVSILMSACALLPTSSEGDSAASTALVGAPDAQKNTGKDEGGKIKVEDAAGSVEVQKVEFRPGVSSATVERLAKRFGCTGRLGAGLITEKGPIEVYRLQCDDGTTFMAQCELRQCKTMR